MLGSVFAENLCQLWPKPTQLSTMIVKAGIAEQCQKEVKTVRGAAEFGNNSACHYKQPLSHYTNLNTNVNALPLNFTCTAAETQI